MIVFKVRVDDQGTLVLDKVGKKAKALEIAFGKTSGLITKAFQGVAMYAGISAFMQAVGNANKEINQFHLNLRKVEQVGGITGKNLAIVTDQMKKLAQETEYTHTQISAAGVTLSRMGINTADALGNTLKNAMDLATVAGEDLTMTAEGLGQIFNIFGIEGAATTVATNKIGVALNSTALDLKGYIEAMQYAGSAAGATKVPFDDLTAAIAYLSQKAIVGSRAGTTMKNILISMVKPGSDAGKALKDSAVGANDLVGMFKVLSEQGVSIDKIVKMFGMWAAPGALGLQQGVKSFQELRDKISEATANVHAQATDIRQSSIPAFQQLMGAITNVGEEFGKALGVEKGALWNKLKTEVIALGDYIKNNQEQFAIMGKSLKILGDALIGISSAGLKFITADMLAFGTGIAGILAINSVSRLSTGIGGLALSFDNLKIAMQGVMNVAALPAIAMIITGATGQVIDKIQTDRAKEESKGDELRGTKEHIRLLRELLDARLTFNALGDKPKEKYLYGTGLIMNQSEIAQWERSKKAVKEQEDALNRMGLYVKAYAGARGAIGLQKDISFWESKANFVGPKTPPGWTKPTSGSPTTLPKIPPPTRTPMVEGSEEWWQSFYADNPDLWMQKAGLGLKTTRGLSMSAISTTTSADFWRGKKKGLSLDTTVQDKTLSNLSGYNPFKTSKKDTAAGTGTWYDPFFTTEEKNKSIEYNKKMDMITKISSASVDLANNTTNFLIEADNRKHQAIIANLESEQKAIDARYQREMASAGDNTFRKQMIEQKYAQQKIAMEAKIEKQRKEIAKNNLVRDKIQATTSYALTILDTMKTLFDPTGGALKIAAGIAMGAATIGFLTQVTAQNYRSGGTVEGQGNSTSDSVWAKVSRGERILSVDELSRVGGNERIQQMIDRSNSGSRSVNININTVYGSKQFVREMISTMKEELAR